MESHRTVSRVAVELLKLPYWREVFITEGHFFRHVRRMRLVYAARPAVLAEASERRLAGALALAPSEAGLQAFARLLVPHQALPWRRCRRRCRQRDTTVTLRARAVDRRRCGLGVYYDRRA